MLLFVFLRALDKPMTGSTLMNEAEFFQWVRQIQALRPASSSQTESAGSSADEEVCLDLIAAFRVFDRDKNGFITKVKCYHY